MLILFPFCPPPFSFGLHQASREVGVGEQGGAGLRKRSDWEDLYDDSEREEGDLDSNVVVRGRERLRVKAARRDKRARNDKTSSVKRDGLPPLSHRPTNVQHDHANSNATPTKSIVLGVLFLRYARCRVLFFLVQEYSTHSEKREII